MKDQEIEKGNTGVGSQFLLQGIFPTQGSNPGLLHCRKTLYHLNYREDLSVVRQIPKFEHFLDLISVSWKYIRIENL